MSKTHTSHEAPASSAAQPEVSRRHEFDRQMLARIRRAKRMDRIMTGVFLAVGGFFLCLIIALAAYIIISGIRSYIPGMLSFSNEGVAIGNQLFDTIYLVFLSLLVSVGIGVPAGIYMAEYAPENKLTDFIRISIESLSSLPSIVVGLFGYLVFLVLTGMRPNLFAGALALSILNLPLVTTETEAAIRSLPKSLSLGSAALGATHWRTITHVLLPAGLPHVVTGIMLAAQRGFGEAAALLYTAGGDTRLRWDRFNPTSSMFPLNPFRPAETLSLHVWKMRTEGGFLQANNVEIGNFSAAVLVLMALLFSVLVNITTKKVHARQAGLRPAGKAKKTNLKAAKEKAAQ